MDNDKKKEEKSRVLNWKASVNTILQHIVIKYYSYLNYILRK